MTPVGIDDGGVSTESVTGANEDGGSSPVDILIVLVIYCGEINCLRTWDYNIQFKFLFHCIFCY